jgi:hypothetical protein
MCYEPYDLGKPDGECPDCGAPTVDGESASGCCYSPSVCKTCGDSPCDDSC